MDDNGLVDGCVSTCMNWISQMQDNWDNLSTYKTTAAKRNCLKLPPKTEIRPCCWNSIRLPTFKWCISVLLCEWSICTQSRSNTFLYIHPIHCISAEARPPKCTTGCTMGAAATMLRESEFNVSGGRSCMKPLERAAKTSWKAVNGNTMEPVEMVDQVRIPKLLDCRWGEGQFGAKIAKIGRQKLNKNELNYKTITAKGC